MFPQEQPLPGTEEESTVRERHGFTRPGERHFNMTGHIVGAFCRVLKMRIVFGYEPTQPPLEIPARRRIRVLHGKQGAARVLAENRHHSQT